MRSLLTPYTCYSTISSRLFIYFLKKEQLTIGGLLTDKSQAVDCKKHVRGIPKYKISQKKNPPFSAKVFEAKYTTVGGDLLPPGLSLYRLNSDLVH